MSDKSLPTDSVLKSLEGVVFDKDVNKFINDEKANNRIFTKAQKDICWNNAPAIPGRDPTRWRIDAVGNPVLYLLRGCHGSLCHEYDHIVPYSKGGKTEVANCQILQTGVNRFKSNKQPSIEEMRRSSRVMRLSSEQMNMMEYAIYGDYGPDSMQKSAEKASKQLK